MIRLQITRPAADHYGSDRNPAADWSTAEARAANNRTIGERWLRFAHSLEAVNPARAERLMMIGRAHLAEAIREEACPRAGDTPDPGEADREHAAANRTRKSHG